MPPGSYISSMKKALISGIIFLLASFACAAPSVTVVGNSIDLALSRSYIDNLEESGIDVSSIVASDLPAHKEDPNIIILGGQNAPEGIGPVVSGLLSDQEKKEVLSSPDARIVVVITNPWAAKQKVLVFAGYEKEQTRKAFADAQGDIMKSLRFNETMYPQDNAEVRAVVPSIDPTQPYTEVSAYEAYAIIKEVRDVGIIDVRSSPAYDAGHIPGALNIPVRNMDGALGSLHTERTYLVYCGGNSESIKAGNILAAKGYKKLYRLVDGYMAWRKAGYPKEVSSPNQ